MTENYDVIIIGSGAGGGTLAHALAGSGKNILLLERGGFLPRELAMRGEEPELTWFAPEFGLSDCAAHSVDFWLTRVGDHLKSRLA